MTLYPYRCFPFLVVLTLAVGVSAQRSNESAKSDDLPKEVRGYKIHRAQVELKKTKDADKKKSDKKPDKDEYDETEPLLIRLGEAQLVSASPLGVTFDVPVILAAVKQQETLTVWCSKT